MDRSAAGLGGTWFLSCLPVALPALWDPGASALGSSSRLALAALPWLAWVGNPCPLRGSNPDASPPESPWSAPLLSAPPLAAALAVDLAGGRTLSALSATAAASLAMICLLAHASRRAGRERQRQLRFALAWGLFVPGTALLCAALEIGEGRAPAAIAAIARASPITWAWQRARVDAGGWDPGSLPWAALALCVALLALAGIGSSAREERRIESATR